MKPFKLNVGTLLLRYYLMMMVILAAGFSGQWWLAILALPIFLSTLMGVSFGKAAENHKGSIVKKMEYSDASVRKAS